MADSLEFIQRQISNAKKGLFGNKSTDVLNKYQGELDKLNGGATPTNAGGTNSLNGDRPYNPYNPQIISSADWGGKSHGGWEGAVRDSNQPVSNVVDPYEEALTKYREQIEALSMETDPDYNENLEQLSPEELEEEIL